MKKVKIRGLNPKEEKLFNMFIDGEPHTIGECQKIFETDALEHCQLTYPDGKWDGVTVTYHANSWVRNSLRFLVKDNWLDWCGKGTYIISSLGLHRLKEKSLEVSSPTKLKKVELNMQKNKVVGEN